MPKVRISETFEVRIPKQVQERVGLTAGQEMKLHLFGDHILLVPVRPDRPRAARPEKRNLISMIGIGGTGY